MDGQSINKYKLNLIHLDYQTLTPQISIKTQE